MSNDPTVPTEQPTPPPVNEPPTSPEQPNDDDQDTDSMGRPVQDGKDYLGRSVE